MSECKNKPTLNLPNRTDVVNCPTKSTSNHQEFTRSTEHRIPETAIASSVVAHLELHITVLDSEGTILYINTSSDKLAHTDVLHLSDSFIGNNYFTVCQELVESKNIAARNLLENILKVFERKILNYSSEYSYECGTEIKSVLVNVFRPAEDDTQLILTHQNIGVEKNAEKLPEESPTEIKKSLSEHHALLNSSLYVICTLDNKGALVTLNHASQNILGYTPEEVFASNFINFIYEEDVENTLATFKKITEGAHIPVYENRCKHKNGDLIPFLWSITYDQDQKLVCCVGKDITSRKKLEKAIEVERDQFYDIFLAAPSAICILKGPDHIYEMVNPLYLNLIDRKDIVGKKVVDVLPELVNQGFIKILDNVYRTGESSIGREIPIQLMDELTNEFTDHYIDIVYQAYRNSEGEIDGLFLFMNDITEQVEAKKRILRSEKQYRQILETAQEGIWVVDKNSRTTFVNKKICETFGYSEKEIIGKKNTYFMNEDSKKISLQAIKRRKAGKSENLEITFISKKGENILTSISATPIFDDAGNFTGALGMLSNITEKKHLENLLEKSNRLARIGSWEIDVVNGSVYWSDITKEIREVEKDFEPDLNTGIGFFTEGVNKEIISARLNQCIKDGTPWDEELQITTFKGNLKWIRTIGEAVFVNGKCAKIYGSFQDITDRKNAVEKVLRSETRLNIAQLIAQVGSWEIDVKTNIQSWSAEFYRILEIDDSIIPSYDAFLPLVVRDDRAKAIKAMNDAFPNQKDSWFDFRFVRKNGELGYASSEWKFEFSSDGKPLYIYGILRDLTIEKKAEIERIKMISDITQRNKDLEQFSYIISHNLRAPVANILGLTEELKDESHNAASKLMLTEALSGDVKRLENVIADLNTILQTKREINERKEIVNFLELVDNIKYSINDLIQEKGVHIKTNFAIEEVNIIKSYIHSIFYNLISNSIKYRKSDCDLLIEITSYMSDDKLYLVFKDNGRGIDLETKGDQLFGLYKRFHADTEGKGMGLYMVKTQLEALGGKISAVSEVNVGTSFFLEFANMSYH